MCSERDGWWLHDDVRILPVKDEVLKGEQQVISLTYSGNSTMYEDDLWKNWSCLLQSGAYQKAPPAGAKVSPAGAKVSPASTSTNKSAAVKTASAASATAPDGGGGGGDSDSGPGSVVSDQVVDVLQLTELHNIKSLAEECSDFFPREPARRDKWKKNIPGWAGRGTTRGCAYWGKTFLCGHTVQGALNFYSEFVCIVPVQTGARHTSHDIHHTTYIARHT